MSTQFFTNDDLDHLRIIKTCEDALPIAQQVLQRMRDYGHKRIYQVCGPISTGGKGNPQLNLRELDRKITHLVNKGFAIFYQIPFESVMEKVHYNWLAEGNTTYCQPILDKFYLPLFESQMIRGLFFIQGWYSSTGARWEYEQGLRLRIPMHFL